MKILAVDYGDSRTGLATCDRTEFLTTAITPQITLKARPKVAARVCEIAAEMGKGIVKRVGIQDQFGQSAPYERLLAMNGVTVENITEIAETLVKG